MDRELALKKRNIPVEYDDFDEALAKDNTACLSFFTGGPLAIITKVFTKFYTKLEHLLTSDVTINAQFPVQ